MLFPRFSCWKYISHPYNISSTLDKIDELQDCVNAFNPSRPTFYVMAIFSWTRVFIQGARRGAVVGKTVVLP